MWLAILIIGTIIGGVIGYFYSTNNYYNGFVGTVLCAAFFFAICFCLKMSFEDKTFICTDVTNGVIQPQNYNSFQKELRKYKPEMLGSKMVLEFFDNSVKCTASYIKNNEEVLESNVLDEINNGYEEEANTPHIYQTESVQMELNEFAFFITSFTISMTDANNNQVVMTYKRKFFSD